MSSSVLRYRFDDPAHYGISVSAAQPSPWLKRRALSQHIRVSERALPRVFNAVVAAAEALEVSQPVTAFVYASPTVNAYCAPDPDSGHILVFVASTLVALLSEAQLRCIVGHELGHAILGHDRYPESPEESPDFRRLELRRAAEISADRAGLVACGGNIDAALRAMLKAASGLGDEHLDVDTAAYLSQARDLRTSTGDETILLSTHPPFPVRVRALLRFDSVLASIRSGSPSSQPLLEIDRSIDRELHAVATGNLGTQFTEIARRAAFWHIAAALCDGGVLSDSAEQALSKRFGEDRTRALRRLLNEPSQDDPLGFVREKAISAREELRRAPLFAEQSFFGLVAEFKN